MEISSCLQNSIQGEFDLVMVAYTLNSPACMGCVWESGNSALAVQCLEDEGSGVIGSRARPGVEEFLDFLVFHFGKVGGFQQLTMRIFLIAFGDNFG